MTIQISNPPSQPQPRVGKFEGNQSKFRCKDSMFERETIWVMAMSTYERERERGFVLWLKQIYIYFFINKFGFGIGALNPKVPKLSFPIM